MLLVTGGAGFIGSYFVNDWLKATPEPIVNVDKLTYAGNLQNLTEAIQTERHYSILRAILAMLRSFPVFSLNTNPELSLTLQPRAM